MTFNIPNNIKMNSGIYCISNVIDDKKYIGQTTEGFYSRYLRHNNLLKNNIHFNVHLQRAYNKYGSDNFEMSVVEICNDESKIAQLEEKWISEFRSKYECYNTLSGGPTMKTTNNPFYGKKHTTESKKKMSEARTGKYTGELNNFYGADHSGKNNGFFGHKHTEESRKKMSKTKAKMYVGKGNPFYGKHHTQEAREKMKNNRKNAARKVMCIETGIVYDSIKIAAKETNTCARSISAVCCGKRNKANGLHWKHMSDRGKSLYENVLLSMDDET